MATPTQARPVPEPTDDDVKAVAQLRKARERLREEISRVVVGQDVVLDNLLAALLCRGHALMVGVPGLGKTLMAKTIASTLRMTFNRIQFTPDLMPSDIIGTDVIEEDPETGRRRLEFIQGPLFTHFLLADEINRAPPKTQAALLQAMQEQEVSVGRRSYKLEPPFFVDRHPEPDRARGDVPAARGPARPVHVQYSGRLPQPRGRGGHRQEHDGQPGARGAAGARRGRSGPAPAGRPRRAGRRCPWSATRWTWPSPRGRSRARPSRGSTSS